MPSIKREVPARHTPPPSRATSLSFQQALHIPADVNSMSVVNAALAYAEAGFHIGPLRMKSKNPGSLLGSKWHEKTSSDPKVIRSWYTKWPTAGVFVHTGTSGVVVFDLDKADDLDELPSEIATELRDGLFQRSRGKGARGHYLFRTSERLGNSAGAFAGWGDVRAGNGVIVVAPSLHATTGQSYEWITTGTVPPLGSHLRSLLRRSGHEGATAFDQDAFRGFVEGRTASAAPERMNGPLNDFRSRVAAGESRHNALTSVLVWACREAREGLYPAQTVVDTFRAEYAATFAKEKPGQRSSPTAGEFEGIVRWAAAQPDSRQAAEQLWTMSPVLKMVQRHAQESFVTPWGLLGVGLLRSLCAIPPSHVLPKIIGSTAPPNLFLALVGDSGTGKGMTEDVANDVFVLPPTAASDLYKGKPGSGEGIPKVFGNYQVDRLTKTSELVFNYSRAFFSMPEVDSLKALFGRESSTLSATLREAWTGSLLGNDYSAMSNKVLVRARRYRLCMVVGVQAERAEPLFADAAGGLPQRFAWVAMADPKILEPTGNRNDLKPIHLPPWESDNPSMWRTLMGTDVESDELIELKVPEEVRAEVLAARARTMRKQNGGLEGHRLLLMEKIALGFAVMHGKTDGFESTHWQMAEHFMAHSDTVREEVISVLAEASRRQRHARARAEGAASTVRDTAAHEALLSSTRERVHAVLSGLQKNQWMGSAVIKRQLSKGQKEVIVDVLADMSRQGEVLRRAASSGTTTGWKFRLRGKR